MKKWHKILGEVEIDVACLAMQAMNGDSSSVFVKHDGEVKEVSKHLVVDFWPTEKEKAV